MHCTAAPAHRRCSMKSDRDRLQEEGHKMRRRRNMRFRGRAAAVVVAAVVVAGAVAAVRATAGTGRPSSAATGSARRSTVTLHVLLSVQAGAELTAWQAVAGAFAQKHPGVKMDV